jgi:hypothetical protein
VQCGKCGEFMYMGKKFNSKMENADGEKFKGIQIKRFWIKCGTCSNQMTFKTDPENDDYSMESGGTRTFEMWQEVRSRVLVSAPLSQRAIACGHWGGWRAPCAMEEKWRCSCCTIAALIAHVPLVFAPDQRSGGVQPAGAHR